ncbi:MAG TPA: nuclear transport factor 2 family protein [Gaiellaceae bacterium]|nr:nuclear transport factor 2 family protein [Gaiellaceae bacterium]
MTEEERLLRRAYEAFNARDIDGALALMHPDVDWPNGMEGGRERGQAAVREYWTRQFGLIDSHVEPEGFEVDDDGRIAVDVHQVVRDLDGAVLSDDRVRHVYTLHDGLVERMDIEEAE